MTEETNKVLYDPFIREQSYMTEGAKARIKQRTASSHIYSSVRTVDLLMLLRFLHEKLLTVPCVVTSLLLLSLPDLQYGICLRTVFLEAQAPILPPTAISYLSGGSQSRCTWARCCLWAVPLPIPSICTCQSSAIHLHCTREAGTLFKHSNQLATGVAEDLGWLVHNSHLWPLQLLLLHGVGQHDK
jgi:hypothetical protein